jgi:acyl-coenzyme A synthetase/AMP-(fatty) acid ligase
VFWELENIEPNFIALIDGSSKKFLTYGELINRCSQLGDKLKFEKKKLVFLFCDNSVESIIAYLSILRSGNVVYLANNRMDNSLKKDLINLYNPEIIISKDELATIIDDYLKSETNLDLFYYQSKYLDKYPPPNKELAVLLSTSGTTGSPKLVKLSYKSIQSNSESIADYLYITHNEKPITSLPISYSYGLSVINSHLQKGAKIVCSNHSMVTRDFWNTFNELECTSFAGVPYNYQILQRLKFDSMKLPSLKYMTQAGGRLSENLIRYFYESALKKRIKFFVMYGQTEATARISFVPFEILGEKNNSIGKPIPNGEIKLYSGDHEIYEPGVEGELVYCGDNVMMGYANNRDDIAKGDEQKGVLHTGDLAYKDEDGYFFITGRLKRFIKLFGLRVNLDEIEKMIENKFNVSSACFGSDDSLKVLLQSQSEDISDSVRKEIIKVYNIHHSFVSVKLTKSIPHNSLGKKDYKSIEELEYNEHN